MGKNVWDLWDSLEFSSRQLIWIFWDPEAPYWVEISKSAPGWYDQNHVDNFCFIQLEQKLQKLWNGQNAPNRWCTKQSFDEQHALISSFSMRVLLALFHERRQNVNAVYEWTTYKRSTMLYKRFVPADVQLLSNRLDCTRTRFVASKCACCLSWYPGRPIAHICCYGNGFPSHSSKRWCFFWLGDHSGK